MSFICDLIKATIIAAILMGVMMGFTWSIKTGYDNFEGVRYTIDTIGYWMIHNPFA